MVEERQKRFVASKVAWSAAVTALCVAVALLASWQWFVAGSDAYKVDGVPFRQWLAEKPDFEVREPIIKLGTNALPHLQKVLRKNRESPRIFEIRQRIW